MGSELQHLPNLVVRAAAGTMDGGVVFCRAIGRVLSYPGVTVPVPESRIEGRGPLG